MSNPDNRQRFRFGAKQRRAAVEAQLVSIGGRIHHVYVDRDGFHHHIGTLQRDDIPSVIAWLARVMHDGPQETLWLHRSRLTLISQSNFNGDIRVDWRTKPRSSGHEYRNYKTFDVRHAIDLICWLGDWMKAHPVPHYGAGARP